MKLTLSNKVCAGSVGGGGDLLYLQQLFPHQMLPHSKIIHKILEIYQYLKTILEWKGCYVPYHKCKTFWGEFAFSPFVIDPFSRIIYVFLKNRSVPLDLISRRSPVISFRKT